MNQESRLIFQRKFQFWVGVSFLGLTLLIVAKVFWLGAYHAPLLTIESLFGGKCDAIDQRIATALPIVRDIPLWSFIALTGISSSILYFSRALTKRAHLRFIEATRRGNFGPRWFNRGIASIFLIALLSLLTGVFAIPLLVVIIILQVLGHVFIYEMERSSRVYVRPDWSPTLIGGWIFSLQVAILVFAGFSIDEMSHLPSMLRFFIIGFFVFKSALLLNNVFQHTAISVWNRSINVEIIYMALDFSVLIFSSALFFAFATQALAS